MKRSFFLPVLLFTFLFNACNDKKGGPGINDRDDNRNNERNDSRDNGKNRDEDDDNSKDNGGSIIGKWRVVDIEAEGQELNDEARANMEKMTIEFTRDGSYYSKDGDELEDGTYTFNERTGMLVTKPERGGDEERVEVVFKGNNKLVITYPQGKITLQRY